MTQQGLSVRTHGLLHVLSQHLVMQQLPPTCEYCLDFNEAIFLLLLSLCSFWWQFNSSWGQHSRVTGHGWSFIADSIWDTTGCEFSCFSTSCLPPFTNTIIHHLLFLSHTHTYTHTHTYIYTKVEAPSANTVDINLGCGIHDNHHKHRVYVNTYLGYGTNEARRRYHRLLREQHLTRLVQIAIGMALPAQWKWTGLKD